jgi:hypothetical protein
VQAACVTMMQPVETQHPPTGVQGLGLQVPHGVKIEPVGQLAALTLVQSPVLGLQHAPGHGLGLQVVPAPSHRNPIRFGQALCGITKQFICW